MEDFRADLTLFVFGLSWIPHLAETFSAQRANKRFRPLIAVSTSGDPDSIRQSLEAGAHDFIVPPFRKDDIVPRIRRWIHEASPQSESIQTLKEKLGLKQFIGESPALMAQLQFLAKYAPCNATVFIAGETGTGKEICARALHYLSRRSHAPFVPINCGAMPAELIENELFGHVRGSFTSANSAAPGLADHAQGGTLFLDEIDSLPLRSQAALLRFLQEKEFRPIGSNKTTIADLRIVAASNSRIEDLCAREQFREDLYYRLSPLTITLPPLRERRGDIPLLARHFIAKYSGEPGVLARDLTPATIGKLVRYDWPGNVRELENVIYRAIVVSRNPIIQDHEIVLADPPKEERSFRNEKARRLAAIETDLITKALVANDGNISKAARALDQNRRAVWRLIQKHHITVNRSRPSAG